MEQELAKELIAANMTIVFLMFLCIIALMMPYTLRMLVLIGLVFGLGMGFTKTMDMNATFKHKGVAAMYEQHIKRDQE